jgi:hypothetical protein
MRLGMRLREGHWMMRAERLIVMVEEETRLKVSRECRGLIATS